MSKKQQRAELAHWLQEARAAEREMSTARTEAAKWLERAKLAHKAGAQELVLEASNRARKERDRFEKAKARKDEATSQQTRLRAQSPEIGVREARYADELLAMFQNMGIDPTTNELDQLVEEETLKAKMTALQKAAGIEPQSDPLELLRQRMSEQVEDAEQASPDPDGAAEDAAEDDSATTSSPADDPSAGASPAAEGASGAAAPPTSPKSESDVTDEGEGR